MRIENQKLGFTLIELLVVVGVFSILGIMVVNLLFTTLKGSTKTTILTEVKQNGEYALSVMDRMVRNSRQILQNSNGQTCASSMTKLKIQNPDGGITEFSCGTQIASVSASSAYLTSNNVAASNCSFSCQQPSGKPAVVTIQFSLSQAGTPPRPEEKATMNFQTTITLRNY